MTGHAPKQTQAWVLHRRPWRESSALVDVITQDHGRVALVARGARSDRSQWRGMIEPFVPLVMSYTQKGDMGSLRDLEMTDERIKLVGTALWCGLYANELLLQLIGRDEPIDVLFDDYTLLLNRLAANESLATALRVFEWQLLSYLGIAPSLSECADGRGDIDIEAYYRLEPEAGFELVGAAHQQAISGAAIVWLANPQAGDVSPDIAAGARQITRLLIDHQLAGRELKTRTLLRQLN